METVLTCPEWIRDSIARAAASIERAYEGDEPALLLEVEAAQIIGALTDAEELAHAVLVRPALQSRTLTVEKLARVLSPQAAHPAAAPPPCRADGRSAARPR